MLVLISIPVLVLVSPPVLSIVLGTPKQIQKYPVLLLLLLLLKGNPSFDESEKFYLNLYFFTL